jgi:hypothetical protein
MAESIPVPTATSPDPTPQRPARPPKPPFRRVVVFTGK